VIEAMYVEHPPAAHGHTNPKAKLWGLGGGRGWEEERAECWVEERVERE
jgi:hypothetical protein